MTGVVAVQDARRQRPARDRAGSCRSSATSAQPRSRPRRCCPCCRRSRRRTPRSVRSGTSGALATRCAPRCRRSARCGSTRSSRRCRARRASAGTRSRGRSRSWTRRRSRVEREVNGLDPQARGRWNNPHNMWSDVREDTIYNANWFGRWANKIDRATGDVLESVEVGHAPTHFVSDPNEHSDHFETLSLPLSAESNLLSVLDRGGLDILDERPDRAGPKPRRTGSGSPPTARRPSSRTCSRASAWPARSRSWTPRRTASCASSLARRCRCPSPPGSRERRRRTSPTSPAAR